MTETEFRLSYFDQSHSYVTHILLSHFVADPCDQGPRRNYFQFSGHVFHPNKHYCIVRLMCGPGMCYKVPEITLEHYGCHSYATSCSISVKKYTALLVTLPPA
ncbi:hypothetical protein PAXRUDRAFT_524074 [Paxillus rubicundulus Ve08.2h10]|uniref:Uncharacterized protein n=1 Tax=Paxillus rubicundulus Ve08.2h10 TaxID=930991 RepID=A0A0D0DN90_9AGAM|nr:hypothetical protein PAXRUDRAFT_524074 [Paxillus rubicundulus Ve08.2h10]